MSDESLCGDALCSSSIQALFLNVPWSFQVSSCAGAMQEVRSRTVAVCRSSLSVKRPSVHVEVGGLVSYTAAVGTPLSLQLSYKLPLTSFIR